MSKSLILVRGIPGSGKTTFAETIAIGAPVISADDYFMQHGKYVFDKNKLGRAHLFCYNTTEGYMVGGKGRIFVANTFTTKKEMKPYYELAIKYGYTVFSIIVENRHGSKNVHDVPYGSLEAMRTRFDIEL
jgi:predicted kinase